MGNLMSIARSSGRGCACPCCAHSAHKACAALVLCMRATISRLPKNIGLLWKGALYKRLNLAKETYILKEPTNHSHPTPSILGL